MLERVLFPGNVELLFDERSIPVMDGNDALRKGGGNDLQGARDPDQIFMLPFLADVHGDLSREIVAGNESHVTAERQNGTMYDRDSSSTRSRLFPPLSTCRTFSKSIGIPSYPTVHASSFNPVRESGPLLVD